MKLKYQIKEIGGIIMATRSTAFGSTRTMIMASLGIVINIVLGTLIQGLQIPLIFLDTIGTIFVAATLGPIAGAMTGGLTNIIQGMITTPKNIPFAIVSIVIGIIVGLIAKKWNFGIKTAIVTGVILAIVAPAIGAPIAAFLFDGVTGGGTDAILMWLRASGQRLLPSVFITRVIGNFIDKIVSCILVSILIVSLPTNFKIDKETRNA